MGRDHQLEGNALRRVEWAHTSSIFLRGRSKLIGHRHDARGPEEGNAMVETVFSWVIMERLGMAQLWVVQFGNIERRTESEDEAASLPQGY